MGVRQQYRVWCPQVLEPPPGLSAEQACHLERFGVLRLDPLVRTDIDYHR